VNEEPIKTLEINISMLNTVFTTRKKEETSGRLED
jgi:hypothetical protein